MLYLVLLIGGVIFVPILWKCVQDWDFHRQATGRAKPNAAKTARFYLKEGSDDAQRDAALEAEEIALKMHSSQMPGNL